MSVKLNKESYKKLIQEDIEVLNKYLPKHSLERRHIEDILLESVKYHYPDNCNKKRVYDTIIPKSVDVYPIEQWLDYVEEGAFVSTDGEGFWVKDGLESDDDAFTTPREDATHVAWYNN